MGKELAKRNIAAFEALDADYIITNAGGCGAFLQEYPHLLKDEPGWAERAEQFVRKLKDFSSVLVDLKFHQKPAGAVSSYRHISGLLPSPQCDAYVRGTAHAFEKH